MLANNRAINRASGSRDWAGTYRQGNFFVRDDKEVCSFDGVSLLGVRARDEALDKMHGVLEMKPSVWPERRNTESAVFNRHRLRPTHLSPLPDDASHC